MRAHEDGGASRGRGVLFHGKPAGAVILPGAGKAAVGTAA
jgi:hypothetical protein